MKFLVYRHISPSGGEYIGITHHRNPNMRWRNGHGYNDSVAFYNAILKYGWDNIKHEIVAENLDEDVAKHMEIDLISEAKSRGNCYNISSGGESAYGMHHTIETKRKIGLSCSSNRWINKDGIEKVVKCNDLEKYLSGGWRRGHLHPAVKNTITINKDGVIKRIQPTELDKYLTEGWNKGLGKSVSKKMGDSWRGCPWVNKNGWIKRIQPTELDKYLTEGWKRGRGPRKNKFNY